MNTLGKLIAKHCPDGVEYKPLGEVCEIQRGERITKSELKDEGAYEVISGGIGALGRYDRYNRSGGTITIAQYGTAGYVAWRETCFWANDVCYTILTADNLQSRYIYFVLKSIQELIYAKVRRDAIPAHLPRKALEDLEIPIPPLPVQKEIVRMLDDMAGLIDALEEELAARKKQYEWCRERLLHEVSTNEHEYKTVGEIFGTITDYTAAGSFATVAQNVVYKRIPDYAQLIRTTDIKSNFQKEDVVYINKHAFDFLWRVHLDAESIILPNVGNCGEVYFLNPSMLPYAHCALAPNALLLRSSLMNNKFLSYWFRGAEFQTQLKKIISPNGQSKFNKTDLRKLKIPLIPSGTQRDIVSKLDDMTALIESLEEELAARKQQYEYYRDKLLAFKRAG